MKDLLILTKSDDDAFFYLEEEIKRRQISYYRFNVDDYPKRTQGTIEFPKKTVSLYSKSGKIDLSSIGAIHYRAGTHPILHKEIMQSEYCRYAFNDCTSFIEGAYILSDAYWLNNPFTVAKVDNKIYQLDQAQKVGLTIPNTIITNSPEDLKKFLESNKKNKIIVKSLTPAWFKKEDDFFVLYSSLLDPKDIKDIESIRHTPVCFQEYIEKSLELRITIVGENVFAAALNSQEHEVSKVDWRKGPNAFSYNAFSIDNIIKDNLLRFMKSLNIEFGAIDMILDAKGNYYFLEANPTGEWIWIQQKTGLPIRESIVDQLESHL